MTFISRIRKVLRPLRRYEVLDVPAAIAKGRLRSARTSNDPAKWLITNSRDEIQSHQISDDYYEARELEQLRTDVGPRETVLDVGANIGNHSVFFIRRMGCTKLIGVEPYGPAYQHLLVNLALNGFGPVELRLHRVALGAESGRATIVPPTLGNIGLTSVNLGTGSLAVVKGDVLVGDQRIDLIKIDVEGMEVGVLKGLASTISRSRPAIYVETGVDTRHAVIELLTTEGYELIRETPAYGVQFNLTLTPR